MRDALVCQGLPGVLFPVGDALVWRIGSVREANALLIGHHYLGRTTRARLVVVGEAAGRIVAAAVWAAPTSRRLPSDGSWLELARWCLTPAAGKDAGSRMHGFTVRHLRAALPAVTTLVSYSDPSAGHTGALYRACNWSWAPTWLRLRPPPTAHGDWGTGTQAVKDRWIFAVRPDTRRAAILDPEDPPAVRGFVPHAKHEVGWLAERVARGEA